MKAIEMYLNKLFKEFPASNQAQALKSDLYRDAEDKFAELCSNGLSSANAEQQIIAEIGDSKTLEDLLPKTNYTITVICWVISALTILCITILCIYYAFFDQQINFDFSMGFLAIITLFILPITYVCCGYIGGLIVIRCIKKRISYNTRRILLLCACCILATYAILMVLYYMTVPLSGYLMLAMNKAFYIFIFSGFIISLGVNY